ncbi:MAG: nuclear transport factor 2 family protein [Planctomycetota bacterium]|nr:nuclear transport factor 2 family protein [Planctomycetota bacterium]
MSHARALSLSLLALTFYSCQTTRVHDVLDDSAGIESAKHAFLTAWTKEAGTAFTLDKLSRAVDTSEKFLSFDGMSQEKTVIEGWKAYAGIWGPGINGFASGSLSESRAVSTWIGDDTAITASIARLQAVMPDGNKLDVLGHLTLGYQRHDGEWRVVHEHMSLGVKP